MDKDVETIKKLKELREKYPHGISISEYKREADISYNTALTRLEVCEAKGLLISRKVGPCKVYNLKNRSKND